MFCADDGVASDAASEIVGYWADEAPSTRIALSEDELGKDPALLFERLEARSLLGERNIIVVRLSGEKQAKLILEALKLADDAPDRFDAKLVVVAGNLKKKSKLRTGFEDAKTAIGLQLFADDAENIEALIRKTLDSQGVPIADSALSALASALPGHRRLAHTELEKVALYAHGLDRPLELKDIAQLSATDVDHALPALVNATLLGRSGLAMSELERLQVAGITPITILRSLQRETERLLAAHTNDIRDARSAARLRPPVWNDHWPSFQKQLRTWPPRRLVRLLARIQETEAMAKESGPAGRATLRRLMADILRIASN